MICFGILWINVKEMYFYENYGIANYKGELRVIQLEVQSQILQIKHNWVQEEDPS